jgi:hypothetical protein
MLRSVFTVASAIVLLAVGAMTASAGNRHANGQAAGVTNAGAITALTSGATLEVKAADDEETAQEAAQAALEAAKAQAAAAAAQAQIQAQVGQAQADDQDVNDEQETDDEGEASD